jgi:hypothetical protein
MRPSLLHPALFCAIMTQSVRADDLASFLNRSGGVQEFTGNTSFVFATPIPTTLSNWPVTPTNHQLAAPVMNSFPQATLIPHPHPVTSPTLTAQEPILDADRSTEVVSGSQTVASRGGSLYSSADFLYAAARGVYVPPLVTLSPPGTSPATAGRLYQPNTLPRFGGEQLGQSFRPGFKLNVGYWFDPARHNGLDVGFFFLGTLTESFDGSTAPGGVILARPFVNGTTGANSSVPFGTTGPAAVAASFATEVIGGDVNFRRGLRPDGKLDLLLGYRYLHLRDDLDVYTSQGSHVPVPATTARTADSFRTRNDFHGPQVGFASHCRLAAGFSLDLLTKLGLGVTVADADLRGSSATALGASPTGLLVAGSNAGSRTTTSFAVVPEVGVKLGYDVTECLRFAFGYSLIYWSRVERAPNQVDLTVGTANRPGFPNRGTDFWVQGWTAGMAWKY